MNIYSLLTFTLKKTKNFSFYSLNILNKYSDEIEN